MIFIEQETILNVALILWDVSIISLGLVGVIFLKDAKERKTFFSLMTALFFFLFIGARICRIINKFYIGMPEGTFHYTGWNLYLQILYTILSFAGLFMIYFAVERDIIHKTRYAFSILVILTTIFSIINYLVEPEISVIVNNFILYPLFIPTILGLPIIYIILAIKSSGIVRRNAILIVIGIILFELGIVFDIPEARLLFGQLLPLVMLEWGAPILQISACYPLYIGFRVRV